ncbi:choice-of-anchor L domain-containing protein [Winogradskyella helgolandensis]|uniref:choice-of-anchor L domain-containing protein n=1 Tax=Winogradskyella helgolandensis TaxID=2697010 RepID=UPI001E466F0F|nr:choice-of-anchor L domain-containing protein [Winogradskyella helgolandensis]
MVRKITIIISFLITTIGFAQDLSMQNGTFNRCAPDIFYDSGGEFGNYGDDDNYTTTICPQNDDDFIIINFTQFTTQLSQDVLTIYDGDDITAAVIGTYSGASSPGFVSASDSNSSGCLTFVFTSNSSGNINGWEAEILCATPCQDIIASIDSTTPAANSAGVIGIVPFESVDFSASALFSIDGTDATYEWDFGDNNTATGANVTNIFGAPGTYTVTLTVTDTNPQGCSGTATVTVFVLGQNVVIDQDTFTPEQLIEDVLIDSPCASVSNIVAVTGSTYTFTEPNGIGYFVSNGIDFPFEDGLLLTSGDASEARGPNNNGTLSDGSSVWPGDEELDTELGVDSHNATYIQFDFIPRADSISFEFLMASEEYDMGSFECIYSDAFAFLLTDAAGNVSNLAVLPGSTTPILVTNIHPDNGSCEAVNERYFSGYTPNNGSPIAFDGRTNVFTAESAVVPGETYTIKLVIADDRDNQYDSGVFIKAGSFNLGGDLGDDITIEAGTAACDGSGVVLDTRLELATHIWYKDDVVIPGEESSTITVTEPGVYYADFELESVCTGSADPIIVEFRAGATANLAPNLVVCSTSGAEEFDLSVNDDDILGDQDPTVFSINYYLTEQDALDNVNALPTLYTNVTSPQTIWARLADASQICVDITSFSISSPLAPTINPVSDLELCDDDSNDGFETFDLSSQTLAILGSQSATDFTVTYYLSFADADAGDNALPSDYTNTVNNQPIFVRVASSGDSSCYNASATALFNLVVNPRALATTPDDMEVCDDVSNDGFATFDLSSQEAVILNGQDPTVYNVLFYSSPDDADDNVGALATSYTNTTANLETIYVRVEDPLYPSCYSTTSFNLIVNALPVVTAVTPLQVCDDDTDGFVGFPLSDKEAELLNGQSGVAVSFHENLLGAEMDNSEIFDGYVNTSMTNQIIFVRLENTTTNCYNIGSLTLEVLENPIANSTTPLEVCDDNVDGIAVFDLSIKDTEVVGTQAGMIVRYYENQADAEAGGSPLSTNYTNTQAGAQEIIARIENGATGCYATTALQLIVNPKPLVLEVSNYELCDETTLGDEEEAFDLLTKTPEILGTQVNVTVSYYANPTDASTETNPILGSYTNISNPQTITAVLTNTLTGCTSDLEFDLIVNPLPVVVAPTALEVCDDGTPDGLTEMDLSLKSMEITGNNPAYSINYYETLADAETETDPLPILYTNTSNGQIIFVRVENTTTGCYDTTELELVVQQAPIAFTPQPLRYCDPDNDGFGVFTLTDVDNEITGGASGLEVTYHETETNAINGVDAIDTTVNYNNIVQGEQILYARIESPTIATDCATVVVLRLIVEPTPQLLDPTPLEACDDISADGFATFDLTSKAAELLNGQDPLQYIVSYYESEANAEADNNPIANPLAYTNTDDFNQIIWIRVEDSTTVEGCYKITSLELIVNPLPVLITPAPLELCDVNNPGDEQEGFILEEANEEILNGQTGLSLTYYETQMDADNATNPITSPYVNTSNAQTIFVRAENDVTGCYNTVTVTLRVDPIPSPEPNPTAIEVCDDDNDGFAEFDLTQRTIEVINGEPNVAITYHETQTDAENGDNPIIGLYTNIVANNQMIFVRSENTVTGCFSLTTNTMELIVLPSPEVPTSIESYTICDTNDNGITQFDLTTKDEEILNGQDPLEVLLTYHVSALDAATGNNPIINVGNYTNTVNPQVIYVRLYNPTTGCDDTGEFELEVNLPPVVVQPTQLSECDDLGETPGDEFTTFDLTVKNNEITGGNSSYSVDYYETDADAQSQTNVIPDPTQYTNTSVNGLNANPQTLYVVVTDTNTGCVDFTTLTIRVLPNPTPTPSDQLPSLELCDDVNTGDGVEVFDLTENEILILNGEAGVTASYYESLDDANSASNAIVDPTQYTNTETPEQEIYVRVTNDATGCYALVDFTIIVHPLPEVVAVTDFIQCELFTDGVDSFDLTTKDEEVLNGQDPTQFIVSYHSSLADAEAGTNGLVSSYTNLSNPQQIFVTITNNITGCSISTQSFNIEVQEAAQANPNMEAIVYETCDDEMETDGDPTNDSAQFDLTTRDAEVLDGQDPLNYIVSYYETQDDADLNVNPLPTLYENITNPQVIYARVDNDTPDGTTGNDTSICYAVAEITLQVNPLPEFNLEDSYILCLNTNGTEVLEPLVIDTGLSALDYSFEWSYNTVVIPGATGPSIMPTQGGSYSVLVTDMSTSTETNCTNVDTTDVIESEPPSLTIELLTQAFADNHILEALATGIGVYEYSLDGGPWQDEGTFINLSAGEHEITARDKNGCGLITVSKFIIDYPLYFTPNGDGNNETWNIEGVGSNAKIYIFDRYGKLLKQLSPDGNGWDGTFSNEVMPTSDYWFTVEYDEPSNGVRKEFRAHFTLKR